MKVTIIVFLLAISATASLSNPINDVEVASKQVVDLFEETMAKFTDTIGITDEEINGAVSNVKTGFLEVIYALDNGKYDESAADTTVSDYEIAITGLAKYMKNVDEDGLAAAIKKEADGFQRVISAILRGKISDLYEAIIKELSGYTEIFAILSKAEKDVDVTGLVRKINDALCVVYTGLYNRKNNINLTVQDAAEQAVEALEDIVTKLTNAMEIKDTDISEAMSKTKTGFLESVDSLVNGIVDEEADNKGIAGWEDIIAASLKHINVDSDEISLPVNNAKVGFQEAIQAALTGSLSELIEAIHKALTGYSYVLVFLSENMGGVDVTEELDDTWKAYTAMFNGIYHKRIHDASSDVSN